MGRLTDRAIKAVRIASKDTLLQDGEGLALRIIKSGNKSWVFRYRRPGDKKQDKFTFASYPETSLKDARKQLIEFKNQLSQGIDPKVKRAAEINQNSTSIHMKTLFDLWINHLKITQEITARTVRQHEDRWNNHLKKYLANILVSDINRSHISLALDSMRQKGIKEETRKALTTISLALDYAVSRHYTEINHARLLKPKDFAASASKPRSRALSMEDLVMFWRVVDEALIHPSKLSPLTATAIKLLIITGARRSEVIGMRWDELDLINNIWTIQESRTKNRLGHTVFLPPIAVELIEEIKLFTHHSDYVFESLTSPGQHILPDSLSRSVQRLRLNDSELNEIDSFSVHDIRRSVATIWGEELKVLPHVIERMLNHQPKDKLIATYQRATYRDEQKEAWMEWGESLKQATAQ